jgi:hypothetical protein
MLWRGHKILGSHGILIATILQPIIFGLLLLYPSNDVWKKALIGIFIVFYIIYIVYSLISVENSGLVDITPECNHLGYKPWDKFPFYGIPYVLLLFLVFAVLLPFELSSIVIALLAITLGLSILIYPCAVGSLWCFSAVVIPFVFLGYLAML